MKITKKIFLTTSYALLLATTPKLLASNADRQRKPMYSPVANTTINILPPKKAKMPRINTQGLRIVVASSPQASPSTDASRTSNSTLEASKSSLEHHHLRLIDETSKTSTITQNSMAPSYYSDAPTIQSYGAVDSDVMEMANALDKYKQNEANDQESIAMQNALQELHDQQHAAQLKKARSSYISVNDQNDIAFPLQPSHQVNNSMQFGTPGIRAGYNNTNTGYTTNEMYRINRAPSPGSNQPPQALRTISNDSGVDAFTLENIDTISKFSTPKLETPNGVDVAVGKQFFGGGNPLSDVNELAETDFETDDVDHGTDIEHVKMEAAQPITVTNIPPKPIVTKVVTSSSSAMDIWAAIPYIIVGTFICLMGWLYRSELSLSSNLFTNWWSPDSTSTRK